MTRESSSGLLKEMKCIPVSAVIPGVTQEEALKYMQQLPAWTLHGSPKHIGKDYHFRDFVEALGYVNVVGQIAEEQGHHPDIEIFQYNKVGVKISTHATGGLSLNDFILAAKIEEMHKSKYSKAG